MKILGDIIEGDHVDAQEIGARRLLVNDPLNATNADVINSGGSHAVLQSDESEIGPLSLMVGDDSAAAGEGGYAAAMHHLTEDGERIATVSADTVHGHWGVYTTAATLGDSEDTQPLKRFVIDGESDVANIEFPNVEQVRMRPNGAGSTAKQMRLIMDADSGKDSYLKIQENGTDRALFWYDASSQIVRIRNEGGATASHLQLLPSGAVKAPTGGPAGAGRIEFANTALYENASGEVVVEDSAGNTTVIS